MVDKFISGDCCLIRGYCNLEGWTAVQSGGFIAIKCERLVGPLRNCSLVTESEKQIAEGSSRGK